MSTLQVINRIDELRVERDQLRTALKAATWRRDRLEMALTALCSAAEGVLVLVEAESCEELDAAGEELGETLYTVRRILQGMGEEMPVAGAATLPTPPAAKETP